MFRKGIKTSFLLKEEGFKPSNHIPSITKVEVKMLQRKWSNKGFDYG